MGNVIFADEKRDSPIFDFKQKLPTGDLWILLLDVLGKPIAEVCSDVIQDTDETGRGLNVALLPNDSTKHSINHDAVVRHDSNLLGESESRLHRIPSLRQARNTTVLNAEQGSAANDFSRHEVLELASLFA
jgi:hypothetical protein